MTCHKGIERTRSGIANLAERRLVNVWPLVVVECFPLSQTALRRTIRTGVRSVGRGLRVGDGRGDRASGASGASGTGAGSGGSGRPGVTRPGATRSGAAACSAADLVAALSGAPGAGSAWALAEGLESGAAAGWDCLERRVRVFAAQERLAGWLTYGRLVETARWVRDWQACPPIGSGLPDDPDQPDRPDRPDQPDDPGLPGRSGRPGDAGGGVVPSDPVARAAMVDRLEGFAAGY